MRWKTTLVLLILTIGIGAYVSLYELKQPAPEDRERLAKEILRLPDASVSQIVIELPRGPGGTEGHGGSGESERSDEQMKVTLNRGEAGWRLLPQQVRADEDLIGRILNQLDPLTAARVLTASAERPFDPQTYGLDPPAARLTFLSNGKPTTLLIGEATAAKGNRYLKVADRPEWFVVSSTLFDDVNQPPEAFRDPILLRVNAWSVDGLALTVPDATVSLERRDNVWTLTRPLSDRADRTEVNTLLRNLSMVRIKRFVNDVPQVEQASGWGFDRPRLEVSLTRQEQAGSPTTLFFGNPLPEDASLIYAKRSDEPSLYAVDAADVDQLRRDPHGLRAKACFEFLTSQVSKVEVARTDAGWAIERAGGQWRQTGLSRALDAERVEQWLGRLADFRLAGFVDDAPADLTRYGLPAPAGITGGPGAPTGGTIAVWTTSSQEPQRLLIGSAIEGSANRYGRIEGRNAVVRLPDLITELLDATPDTFQPNTAPPSSPAP